MPNTQTIQFNSVSARQTGVTITAAIWSGVTNAGTIAGIAEDATLDGQYTGTVTDVAAGDYKIDDRANGYSIGDPSQQQVVTLVAATGDYVARRVAVLDSAARVKLNADQPDYAPATVAALSDLQTDVDANTGYLVSLVASMATLLDRITAPVAVLWADLRLMITGTGAASTWSEESLSLAPVGEGMSSEQAEQLTEIHEGLFPPDPDDSPTVITPGVGNLTTGYLVALDHEGEPVAAIPVYYQMLEPTSNETGFAYNGIQHSVNSAGNGVAQFPLVKGASYLIWRNKKPQVSAAITIPADAGDTYELPSIVGRP